jgi:hypothetical protein
MCTGLVGRATATTSTTYVLLSTAAGQATVHTLKAPAQRRRTCCKPIHQIGAPAGRGVQHTATAARATGGAGGLTDAAAFTSCRSARVDPGLRLVH